MTNFETFVKGCCAMGSKVVNPQVIPFQGGLPHRSLEIGCKILIPEDPTVLEEDINWNGNMIACYFIPVQITFPDEMVIWDKLHLNTLTRVLKGFDHTGNHFYDYARGTVNDLVRTCSNWAEALTRIKGSHLRVKDIRTYEVQNPNTGVVPRSVYDLDFC